jgi:hypothetical protein
MDGPTVSDWHRRCRDVGFVRWKIARLVLVQLHHLVALVYPAFS